MHSNSRRHSPGAGDAACPVSRHVERLIGLGAIRVEDWSCPQGADFVVMRDPDGSEFCVIDHPGS
jgi:glyoxalase superfamily protein